LRSGRHFKKAEKNRDSSIHTIQFIDKKTKRCYFFNLSRRVAVIPFNPVLSHKFTGVPKPIFFLFRILSGKSFFISSWGETSFLGSSMSSVTV